VTPSRLSGAAIKERPILFSGEMVRAILEGRKTQTRRLIKPQPDELELLYGPELYHPTKVDRNGMEYPGDEVFGIYSDDSGWPCPYGAVGDRLWVRETWQQYIEKADGQRHTISTPCKFLNQLLYAATEQGDHPPRWRPSIHMPRWASRITLEITGVRVERLQKITKADVIAEGIQGLEDVHAGWHQPYADLWVKINGPDSWDANPWVWAIEFRRIPCSD
jgi:hypothetical protein